MLRRNFVLSLAAGFTPALEGKEGARPRLFLDAAGFARLRPAIKTTHAPLWAYVKQQADAIAATPPPSYAEQFAKRGEKDSEQLWQRDVGNKLPYVAMAYRLTDDPVYLRAAKDWALASCGYPHWGLGTQDGAALSAGHQLVGLAVVYDWLHHAMDATSRETIRRTLIKRCGDAWRGIPVRNKPLLQNHLWVPATGLAAAALALSGDPDAERDFPKWIDYVHGKYSGTEAALGSDGASHEGIGYWSYGVEYMLKYWHLAADLLGRQPSSPWWRNTAAYYLYLSLPRNAWTADNNVVDIADSPRTAWYGPDYLLRRLAHLYHDAQAQWLATELNRTGHWAPSAAWLNLVWYDPSVPATPPTKLPSLRHFTDMDIVSARSGWSGDESMVVLKCGPPAGHESAPKFDLNPGIGHVHPDANHFVVIGAGEWLVKDDGYQTKMTSHHNTLLIDGQGQLGEGGDWLNPKDWYPLPKSLPRILRAVSTPDIDEIIGDATAAYPERLGLKRFLRRLYFLKPDVLLVVDEVTLDAPRKLELSIHPEHAATKDEDGAWTCRGKHSVLRVDPLSPEGVAFAAEETPIRGMHGRNPRMFALRMTAETAKWRNAVALSWCAAGRLPAKVTLERGGELWVLRSGSRKVYVNFDLRVS